MSVSCTRCVEGGIVWGVIGGFWGYFLGEPYPSIIQMVSTNIIGVSFGNAMVHHVPVLKDFSNRTKCIIEVAFKFFTNCLLFKIFQYKGLIDRDINIRERTQEDLFWAVVDYMFGITYIKP